MISEKIYALLEEQFGTSIDLEFKEMGKMRIYAFKKCELDIETHNYGVYFGKLEKDGLRLSIEGSQMIGPSAKKGVFEVDKDKVVRWMSGEDIEGEVRGYVMIKWINYFMGCGKGNGVKIRNFIPKGRRISANKGLG
ncbi:MAG: methyltransferase RsmF C-terminal domain-like protein, partial [Candidatus Hadarchaeota archaeon]